MWWIIGQVSKLWIIARRELITSIANAIRLQWNKNNWKNSPNFSFLGHRKKNLSSNYETWKVNFPSTDLTYVIERRNKNYNFMEKSTTLGRLLKFESTFLRFQTIKLYIAWSQIEERFVKYSKKFKRKTNLGKYTIKIPNHSPSIFFWKNNTKKKI